MKTPKEKAKELVDKYTNLYPSYIVMFPSDIDNAIKDIKKCALIAVDLIIYHTEQDSSNIPLYEYYLEVKQEIKNISKKVFLV